MGNSKLEQQISKLGLTLPVAPDPVGSYKATIISNGLVYISGQLPIFNGVIQYKGKIGLDLSIDDGYRASEICALNILSQINKLGNQYVLKGLLRVDGYINCTESFVEHASVLDGASNLFSSVLGCKSDHVRSVLGCSSLPLGAAVEVTAIIEVGNLVV